MKTTIMTAIATITLVLGITTQAQQPDNAALLYYQAFLLYENPEGELGHMLDDYRKGNIESNEKIVEHIKQNRAVIDLVVKATEIDTCNWGYDRMAGFNLQIPNLSPLRRIAFLLSAEARWLAEQGDYATALDRCIAMRKMAIHTGDRILICYLVGTALDALANQTIQNVLNMMPADVEELNDLKTRLNQTQERFPTLAHALSQEAEMCVVSMRKDTVQEIIAMTEGDHPMIPRLLEGDEDFFKRNRDYYNTAMKKLIATTTSDLPYDQMCLKLDELANQPSQEAKENPDAILTAISLPAIRRVYQLEVRQKTRVNALNVAIDLYLAKAKTGQLPDTLPVGAPVDLYSGQPFAYEKTAKGFTLRCRAKELPDKEVSEYEFTVQK